MNQHLARIRDARRELLAIAQARHERLTKLAGLVANDVLSDARRDMLHCEIELAEAELRLGVDVPGGGP